MTTGSSLKALPSGLSVPIAIESVPIARVSAFFGKADEGASETWRCALVGSPHHAWVKLDDDPRRVIADLVCSQVGRALGLPIPRPHLVQLEPEDIPADSAWHGRTTPAWVFASQHAGKHPKSFARHLTDHDSHMLRALAQWDGLHAAMAFDEWIANNDRNNGNMLYDPVENGFWLIDHGAALTGVYWPLWGLDDPKIVTKNMLADAAAQDKINPREARDIANTANKHMARAADLCWDMADSDQHIARLDNSIERDAVLGFLMQRIQYTTENLMQRFGFPQLELRHGNTTRPLDARLH